MTDYDKLGSFYLGRERDVATGEASERLALYDSSDLTTHAVIIGMTGSGKTGLGIGMIGSEEELRVSVDALTRDPAPGATFAPVPEVVTEASVAARRKLYERWLRASQSVMPLEAVTIRPKASGIHVHFVGIAWRNESRVSN